MALDCLFNDDDMLKWKGYQHPCFVINDGIVVQLYADAFA